MAAAAEFNQRVGEMFAAARDADDVARKRLEGVFAAYVYPFVQRWVRFNATKFGDPMHGLVDDAAQKAMERLLLEFRGASNPKFENVTNLHSYLKGVTVYSMATFYGSTEGSWRISGAVALNRRVRKVAAMRSELRRILEREPSPQEVVDAYNTKQIAALGAVKAQKQGALTELDEVIAYVFDNAHVGADIDAPGMQEHARFAVIDEHDEDKPLATMELPALIEAIIEACFEESPELGETARIWLGPLQGDDARLGSSNDVAHTLHCGMTKASGLVRAVREVARAVAVEQFGIEVPFAADMEPAAA